MTDRWFRVTVSLHDPAHDLFPTPTDPACRNFAWTDLIALARWRDGPDLKRSQLRYSQRYLAARWHRSLGWVNRLLQDLEKGERILRTRTPGASEREIDVLTICNYDRYQPLTLEAVNTAKNADGITNGYTNRTTKRNKDYYNTTKSSKDSSPRATGQPNTGKKPHPNWVAEAVDIWAVRGALSFGEVGRALKPVVEALGAPEALALFRVFAANGKAEFGPGWFAKNFRSYDSIRGKHDDFNPDDYSVGVP